MPVTQRDRSIQRTVLWPFVYWPLIFVGAIHVATRVAWLLGFK